MKRPALTQWHKDALLALAVCFVLGSIGALVGALVDRRLHRCA